MSDPGQTSNHHSWWLVEVLARLAYVLAYPILALRRKRQVDVQNNPPGSGASSQTPFSQTGTAAAATLTVTQAAVAKQIPYVTHVSVYGLGATVATTATVTLAIGGVTLWQAVMAVPAGVLLGTTPVQQSFNPPLTGNVVNQNVVLTVSSFGAGNTEVAGNFIGYSQ